MPHLSAEQIRRLATFPDVLRELVFGELAAGNQIIEMSGGFPAPPAGALLKLARRVTTRVRASGDGVYFRERNSSLWSGEFTDEQRFFFVMEPPDPPPEEPDMNSIRARAGAATQPASLPAIATSASAEAPSSAVERFRASMTMDFEKWHDGIGYSVEAITHATPAERAQIESLLLSRAISDWRDVEALALLNTPDAREALRHASQSTDCVVALAVAEHAPDLVSEELRIATLVAALEREGMDSGLSQVLDQVAVFHPPPVVDALFRGVIERNGATAMHFAAMLLFIHGQATTSFDWDQRPFLLQFHTEDTVERATAFGALRAKIM